MVYFTSGNPDAAERFFTKPLYKDTRNDLAVNDDLDDQTDEDVPGGTNVGLNFPHLFKFYVSENGLFPGSAPEAYALMRFVFTHLEIAITGISFISSLFSNNTFKKYEDQSSKIRPTSNNQLEK
jgi:hypothetical protein